MEEENIIFTKTEWAYSNIADAFNGWLIHYSNYISLKGRDYNNIIGMNKYAIRFITLTSRRYKDFLNDEDETKLNSKEIEYTLSYFEMLNQEQDLERIHYNFLNEFFSKYLDVSGITNILRQKDNINKSILKNR